MAALQDISSKTLNNKCNKELIDQAHHDDMFVGPISQGKLVILIVLQVKTKNAELA